MNSTMEALVTIATAIIGVAIIAVLVSSKSNTTGVLQAGASGFGNSLAVALSPVTGNTVTASLAYPASTAGAYGTTAAY